MSKSNTMKEDLLYALWFNQSAIQAEKNPNKKELLNKTLSVQLSWANRLNITYSDQCTTAIAAELDIDFNKLSFDCLKSNNYK